MNTQEFVSSLFEVEVNSHIAHLQTSSYAEHMALGSLYEDIVGLRDRFIEGYQGKYGIISGYQSFTIKEVWDALPYLKGYLKQYEAFRLTLKDGFLQQICDDIIELFNSTIYKIKFLK